jgi:hypothetical protein
MDTRYDTSWPISSSVACRHSAFAPGKTLSRSGDRDQGSVDVSSISASDLAPVDQVPDALERVPDAIERQSEAIVELLWGVGDPCLA